MQVRVYVCICMCIYVVGGERLIERQRFYTEIGLCSHEEILQSAICKTRKASGIIQSESEGLRTRKLMLSKGPRVERPMLYRLSLKA